MIDSPCTSIIPNSEPGPISLFLLSLSWFPSFSHPSSSPHLFPPLPHVYGQPFVAVFWQSLLVVLASRSSPFALASRLCSSSKVWRCRGCSMAGRIAGLSSPSPSNTGDYFCCRPSSHQRRRCRVYVVAICTCESSFTVLVQGMALMTGARHGRLGAGFLFSL